MNIARGWVARSLILLLVALAAGIILKEVVAPSIVRRRLISAVQNSCKTCELSLSPVHISLMPLALSGSRIHFTGGMPNATVVHAEAERVYIPVSLFPLLTNRFRAGQIEIEHPVVKITEGDLYASSSTEDSSARPFDLEIEGIKVKNGSFIYNREHLGHSGSLNVSRINIAMGPVGSSDRLRDTYVESSADGLLEESGQFHLQVNARIFAKIPDVKVKLQISGQDLAALNPFLKPNDGVQLKGMLIDGQSEVAIRGVRLKSSAYLRFRKLGVKIKKTDENSAFSAFVQTLMASITMGKQNIDGGDYDRTGMADLERKQKETIISFTLRGMKEAAMKVVSQGGK
ncbi:MAG: hypothetical protein A2021_05415 [Elusimicrobia bacterium GWF2_52_66]|nr:MAG: hypothetical protein A2X33_07450 [Elusimicrobia bacterium GWA2_51_34]OGR85726.1 MAG: hypothetical protein A2021_05415 [Elusimicrobia bacterium GWF2_52_66]HAF94892.1 hypothetical protein [Elusimicrobiota bacterium]HCE97063.1 hypothetical protein [Elusimicrobiota bacterium]